MMDRLKALFWKLRYPGGEPERESAKPGQLVEYLYVDEDRLDKYFEQFSPPVRYDRVPNISGEVSVTGARLQSGLERHGRPFTTHEKVTALIDYLRANQLVAEGRSTEPEPAFRIETCTLTSALITSSRTPRSIQLRVWFSESDTLQLPAADGDWDFASAQTPRLYLLKEFEEGQHALMSGFSLLYMLAENAEKHGRIITVDPAPTPNLFRLAVNQPIEFLTRLGATIGAPRTVKCLYRRRFGSLEGINPQISSHPGVPFVVGYPIAIMEPDSPQSKE